MDNLPKNLEMEQALIGCLVMDHEAPSMAQANFDIQPEMFSAPIHQSIVRAIYVLNAKKHGYVDPLMVNNEMRKLGIMAEMPRPSYLHECAELSPGRMYMASYCAEIKSLYQKRQVIKTAADVGTHAYEAENGLEYLMSVPQRFFDLMPKAGSDLSLADSLQASVDQWRRMKDGELGLPGLSTGIAELDDTLTGLKPGSYNIIAARPSAGKTSLAGTEMLPRTS